MPRAENNFTKKSRMSWDEFFMSIALTATQRTACILHKAAAVFVDADHKIISIGYNGPSVGDYHCNEVGCVKIHGDPITGEIRRCNGVHSEINGIINAGNTAKLKNATLYITLFPCYDCMKALNNIGVKRIVYYDEYLRVLDGSDGTKKVTEPESKELAIRRGIIFERFRLDKDEVKIEEQKIEEPDESQNKRF